MKNQFSRNEVIAGFGKAVVANTEIRASEHITGCFSQWILGLGTLMVQQLTNGKFIYYVGA